MMKKYITKIILLLATVSLSGCVTPHIKNKPVAALLPLEDQWKEYLIIDILSNTPELNIHRMNGQIHNQVYLGPTGHREGVYDANGNLVTDPANAGSFNFFHPSYEPLGHFQADMSPWFPMGNGPGDTTSLEQRINAYMKDLKIGIGASYYQHRIGVNKSTVTYETEADREVVSLFLSVINESGNSSLFEMYKDPSIMTEAKIDKFLVDIKPIFKKKIMAEQPLSPFR